MRQPANHPSDQYENRDGQHAVLTIVLTQSAFLTYAGAHYFLSNYQFFMRILIIQQKMIGDVLTCTILCENLKRHFSDCHIDFVANDNTLAVVKGNPYIDSVIVFKKEYAKSKRRFFAFLRSLKKNCYDVVIDAYGKTESNLITFFTKADIKISHYKPHTQFLYTHPLKGTQGNAGSEAGLAIRDKLLLLQPLLKSDCSLIYRPKIHLAEDEIRTARQFLEKQQIDLNKPLVMIGVLGSKASKTYPLLYMAEVINTIAHHSEATLLFNYIPNQEAQAKLLYSYCDPTAQSKIRIDVDTADLRGFLGVLYHCDALISNEGGAVNMAKALCVPTFSIFSPLINMSAWHLFADEKNVAVHLRLFKPELFKKRKRKKIKRKIEKLYSAFKPSLFEKDLQKFIKSVLNQQEIKQGEVISGSSLNQSA